VAPARGVNPAPVARRAKTRSGPSTRPVDAPKPELAPRTATFDFLASKIQVPILRPGTVWRTSLVNHLRATSSISVVAVVAPAGYGKTTLLAQWAERDPRQFAWISLDDRDNDPVVLLRHITATLERSAPVEPRLIQALRSPGSSIWSTAVPRLAAAMAARHPMVLVLDDFNALHSRASLETVAALIDDEAEESLLVVTGRVPPRLPLASLRAKGRLLELGINDLALTRREAQLLLRATGVTLSEARTDELIEQCEGWAAALCLAALSVREAQHVGREAALVRGDSRYLADYFRSEYLAQLRPGPLRFLRRTSVLDRMCGPLCDAVLQDEGSARELEKIERANLLLVGLDDRREWFRYHHLFRELLESELTLEEPELVPELHRRAADWFEAQGDRESALEHAFSAGDYDRAAAILAAVAMPVYYSGRVATLEGWLKRFERAGLVERYPVVALHGYRIHALRGRAGRAERWLQEAERGTHQGVLPDGSPSIKPWLAVGRAWLCQQGARRMLEDAKLALAELPETSNWRPSALAAQGWALMLLGEAGSADSVLADAAESAAVHGSTETHVIALGGRALLATLRDDHEAADRISTETNRLIATVGSPGAPAWAVEHAASARRLLRHGRWNEAREALTAARDLLPYVTVAIPWLAVQTRIDLARGFVTLRDGDAARELQDDVEQLLGSLPDLGVLAERAAELREEVDAIPEPAGTTGLTPAELRLLPLLATHLSFREIAEQLFVSRNTIKTQAISVYRKLGASSRSGAIAEAHRLGLDEHLRVLISNPR
jgi:LuxR family maltose regulon positive regulatory protein